MGLVVRADPHSIGEAMKLYKTANEAIDEVSRIQEAEEGKYIPRLCPLAVNGERACGDWCAKFVYHEDEYPEQNCTFPWVSLECGSMPTPHNLEKK
jgi:hypothetical protein